MGRTLYAVSCDNGFERDVHQLSLAGTLETVAVTIASEALRTFLREWMSSSSGWIC